MTSLTGKLIVVEGLEGAGKSTAINTVKEFLTQNKINTITTREPGGTEIGEVLRDLIKNPKYRNVLDDKSELLLLYTARIQLLEQVIKPALSQGTWVIADRFELSSLAYQGGGRGLSQEVLGNLSAFALQGFKPHLTLYLDISPEEGLKRVKSRGQLDRIELQTMDFFHRVHECYLQQITRDSDAILIDASLPIESVQAAIKRALTQFSECFYE